QQDGALKVALIDPLDPYPLQALGFATEQKIAPIVARMSDIEAALDRLYGSEHQADGEDPNAADEADVERLKDLASDAPVVRLVNGLITRASESRASDIHIEPTDDAVKVRFRVDGALKEIETLPAHLKSALVSRIKVMSGLDIAERRLPQDGRLRIAVRGHEIDLRVATSPTIHGETVVLRILDRSKLSLDFKALGFDDSALEPYLHAIRQPHGIVLVTGPTGSGKTTTLYASLSVLNSPDRKILTIEDPIEYRLAGINQTQVKPQIGLTFAAALRSFLRQDPDVMMVGEIRDLETAEVAVQSALTGHTILSTLHTNDASSTVTRLLDMGVEPFLITSTLNAVLAQRLVRRLCPHCREEYVPSEAALHALSPELTSRSIARLYRPVGCDACDRTGFRGRLVVTELLEMNDDITRLVLARAEAREIQRAGIQRGMRTMFVDGLAKAQAGLTTIEEVLRATREV
ncbi:MAG: Flp pilus assembly complex ATPase component TadA, partial [Alphaproteobacteria bacterium]|nr:Flp pilus assembly complex ATPase component TadA [Alphaproteobacteria bacterium]